MPSAYAAGSGRNPMSIRYRVWWTWIAYQAKSPVKKPMNTHQKRAVRVARARVHSVAAQTGSTILTGATAGVPAG